MEVVEWCDMPHSRFVLKSLHQMQKTNKMCDVVLLAANERIPAHKLMLCAVSEYFRTLQNSNFKESINNEIEFGELSGNTLRQMIRFIYTGKIEINDSNVYDLMSASHLLQISILKLVISNYLVKALNTNNCLEVLAYAKLYTYQELFGDTLQYITENFHFVATNSVFLQTPIDVVKYVFCQRNLNLRNMCRAFERWLNNNRRVAITPCIDEAWKDYLKNVREKIQEDNHNNAQILELINKIENIIKENYRNEDCNVIKDNNLLQKEVILCIGGSSRGAIWNNIECLTDIGWSLSYPPHSVLQENNIDESMYTVAIPPMKEPRMCSTAVKFDNIDNDSSVIYMLGGLGTAHTGAALKTCEKYDIRKNEWCVISPLPYATKEGAAIMYDETLIFTGGVGDGSDVFDNVWEYYEKYERWKFGSKLQQARCCHGVSNVMGSLYVMGGRGAQGMILSSVERYNADLRTWSYVCEMPEAKCEFGCVTINEYIYVLGGATKFFVLNSVQRYNTITDKWEKCADMPIPKCGFGCTVKEEKIFCIGGSNIAHGPLANVEVYNANTNRWTYLQDRLLTHRGYTCAATVKILVDPKTQNC